MNRTITDDMKKKVADELNLQLKVNKRACITIKDLYILVRYKLPRRYHDENKIANFRYLVHKVLYEMPEFQIKSGIGILLSRERRKYLPPTSKVQPTKSPNKGSSVDDIDFAISVNGILYEMTLKKGRISMTINRKM